MKFSIVIPCYNVAVYLEDTLKSVLAQTFRNWECICVDDGSTDGTAAILDAYAHLDGRFRVVHKANEGVSAARNDAIKLTTGDYVCFLDGDDVWAPEWLAKIDEAAAGGRADIVRMAFTFWREDVGEAKPDCDADSAVEYIEGADKVLEWGWTTYTTDGYIWLNAVKRSLLVDNDITFPVGMKINEDIIFDLSLLPFAKCVAQSSYAGYFYRMRATSAWHSKRPIEGCTRYLAESIKLWEASREQLERMDCLPQIRRNEAFMFYSAVLQWFDFGLKEERCRANEIAQLLKHAAQLGMIDLRAIPVYWRPAFRWAIIIGSFLMARVTFLIIDYYHRSRRCVLKYYHAGDDMKG